MPKKGNASKPKKLHRVPLQVRIAPDAARVLKAHTKEHKNKGHALDFAIRSTWP